MFCVDMCHFLIFFNIFFVFFMFTVFGISDIERRKKNEESSHRPAHGLLIEYGPICYIVKLRISMIRPFSLVNISHITLYPQLEIIWKVSKSLRKYWGKYGQISFYIISCITRDCIIVENISLV